MAGVRIGWVLAALLVGCPKTTEGPTPMTEPTQLAALTAGQAVHGFTTEAVYLDDADRVLGARFVHDHTGFVLDYVQLESVPQGFLWVNTVPTSDQGEPHTQEHLLLGKGNKGRAVASLEDMWLVDSSAFTEQVRTCYHFHTASGPTVFHDVLERQLDALLNPDYTDEEIRREVHHYGVATAEDGTLHMEEKGTVYNEMVSSSDRWGARLWRSIEHTLWGPTHPYALNSGGWPADIRTMQPEDIRGFHAATHHLGNMELVAALPPSMAVDDVLTRLDETLVHLQPEPTPAGADFVTEADLPAPSPAPEGTVQVVGYPSADASRPGEVLLAWPAQLDLEGTDQILLELFLSSLASSEASPLYERLVDTKTREVDWGATGSFGFVLDRVGWPVFVGLEDVRSADLTEETAKALREAVRSELSTIAGWEPGDPALEAFNALLQSELAVRRRAYRKMVNSPPRFGFRGTGSTWMDEVNGLARDGGFERSLTRRPSFEAIEALLAADPNPWTAKIGEWRLLDIEPYAFATKADPQMLEDQRAERETRLQAEVDTLKAKYGTGDDQEALRQFSADYDADTKALEAVADAGDMPPFVDTPPLTLDDALDYRVAPLGDTGIPALTARFASMSGATTSLALSLEGVPRDQWVYLAALPALVRRTGIHDEQGTLSQAEVLEQIQREILSLSVYVDADYDSGRQELVVSGSGTDLDEARKSLVWARRLLAHADWREENLPRLRDLLDEVWTGLRSRTQGSEESWVQDPATAYRRQDAGRLLMTESFLTQTFAVLRLRWMLVDTGPDADAVAGYLDRLGARGATLDRDALVAHLEAVGAGDDPSLEGLSDGAKAIVGALARDLGRTLPDVPDASLSADFAALCAWAAADTRRAPADALADLGALRESLLVKWRARAVLVGSPETLDAMGSELSALTSVLVEQPIPEFEEPPPRPLVGDRLADRGATSEPLFVGLVVEDLPSGVFVMTAPSPTWSDTDREALLDVLAGNTYTGGGAHSLFMKTWGAGLAYSNGVRPSVEGGVMMYYAERCPKLPQTLRFVIDTLREAPVDEGIARYAIAKAFYSRAASTYEGRAWAMSADLQDGDTPERVRAFREALLGLRDEPQLPATLHERLPRVYGQALPGWGPASADVEGAVYFVIGPEPQLQAWEAYLATAEGEDADLVRLYPRDFWMTD